MKKYTTPIFAFTFLISLTLIGCKPSPKDSLSNQRDNPYIDPNLARISQMIEQNPNDPDLWFDRASLFYEQEAYDEAIEDLRKAIEIDSLKPRFYHLLSDTYLDYYQSRRALTTMEDVVKLFPNRVPSLLKLSETQFILKQYIESISTLNRVIRVDPQNAEAYFMLGMNFRETGDEERATNSFQTATEMDPELIDAWIILGSLYEDREAPEALQYYENALRVDSLNIQALHSKAFYLQNHEDIAAALKIYKKINRIDPQYVDAYLNAGILRLEQDSIDLAFEQFNILANIDPSNYLAYYYRGFCHELRGEYGNAKNDFQSTLNIYPDFERAQEALNRLAEAQ